MTERALRVENQLLYWAHEACRSGIHVTRDMIRTQAACLATETSPYSTMYQSATQASGGLRSDTLPESTRFTSIPADGSIRLPTTLPVSTSTGLSYLSDFDIDLFAHRCDLTVPQGGESPNEASSPAINSSSMTTLQTIFPYNTLGQPALHDPGHDYHAIACSQPQKSMACQSQTCTETHVGTMDAICSQEARRAFNIVESYISNSPKMTALDQLCLNHVKARLDGSQLI